MSEPHLDADELEEAVETLNTLLQKYGTLGIDEAYAELKRRLSTDEIEVL